MGDVMVRRFLVVLLLFFGYPGQHIAVSQSTGFTPPPLTTASASPGTTAKASVSTVTVSSNAVAQSASPLLTRLSHDPVLDAKLASLTSSLDDLKRKLDSPKQENWIRDYAPVLISLFSVGLAGVALFLNSQHNDRALLEKAREEERKSIREKLDQFYGPMIQLRGVSQSLYEILNERRQGPENVAFRSRKNGRFRTLFALLNGAKFSGLDRTLLDEIVSVGEASGKLIAEKVGLVDDPKLQNLLWRVATHYRILALAAENKLEGGGTEFDAMGYPYKIIGELENKAKELNDRLKELQQISSHSMNNLSNPVLTVGPESSQHVAPESVSVTAGEGTTLSARAGQTEIGGFR